VGNDFTDDEVPSMTDELAQARMYFDRDMSQEETVLVGGGIAAVYSAPCPGRETANEDAAGIVPSGLASAILIVADGLGGGPSGQHASGLAVKAIGDAVQRTAREGHLLRTAVLNGLEAANEAVQGLGVGAATTVAAVEIQDGTARPYHVGDSMILVVGRRGKIKLQTTSHSPIGFAVEAGFLAEEDAMHHEDRHIVSNVVGSPEMKIEIGPILRLAPRDTLLLASDGLFDNLHIDEIVQRVRKGKLGLACRRLAEDARLRMISPAEGQPSKPDDLTFVLFRHK
jgi:serine/threonine protein phosphatase PrpC